MELYHITKDSFLNSILKEGLIPQIGQNSLLINDEKTAVFLTEEKYIDIWAYLLKGEHILKVNIDDNELTETYDYGFYSEFIYNNNIEKDKISYYKPCSKEYNNPNIRLLLKRYIYNFCYLAKAIINRYESQNIDEIKYTLKNIKLVTAINLSYKNIFTKEELRNIFIEYGQNGAYTLFDTRIGTDKKMYEQLLDISNNIDVDNESKIILKNFYNYIITQFSECLDLDTGGWE